MFKDMERNSKYWNIQLKIPHDFSKTATSKTTANAQRLLIALQLHDSALVEPVARAMWQRLFTHSQGIFEKNELEEARL
uniref:DSBA domain-containing protein n=1 Tax=Heterorhabditis bacteriophora TaxID=37862 RepID=A0A1I7XJ28_HETBA